MNLITSASSEIYQQAFSPGLRRTAGSVTATDVLILVLIAVLIVYLLARTFQGQCRTVCHQVCPMDGAEHMTGDLENTVGSKCLDQDGNELPVPSNIFGTGCVGFDIKYKNHENMESHIFLNDGSAGHCISFADMPDGVLKVRHLGVSGIGPSIFGSTVAHNCNVAKVKVDLEMIEKNANGNIQVKSADAQDLENNFVLNAQSHSSSEQNASDGLHETEGDNPIKFWKIRKIFIE